MSLLEELLEAARRRASQLPREEPPPRSVRQGFDFHEALRGRDRLKVIAEFKRASPSEGRIATAKPIEQVRAYVRAGASALSVLTEPTRFDGSYEDLEEAVCAVKVPVLMKDFVVDTAQVRHAARLGAGGVLLIHRCLSASQLNDLVAACRHYRLTPFIECHDEGEIASALALAAEAVIGVNNRNLATLEVEPGRAERLLRSVPEDRIAVAESGYGRPEQTRALRGVANAVLMGTALMKAPDPGGLIREVIR